MGCGRWGKLEVNGISITVTEKNQEDFISLTDIANGFEGGSSLIEKWIRNKNTIEFLAVWERLYNPDFDENAYIEIIKSAGSNRFVMSAKQWIQKTNAIGIMASAGRYGGTNARIEIAYEFATWLNPYFKMLSIKKSVALQKDYDKMFEGVFQENNLIILQSCYIYLMQDTHTKLYKIGISIRPIYREKTSQSEKPDILMLFTKELPTQTDATKMENMLHEKYKEKRVRGEWFNLSDTDVSDIEDLFFQNNSSS